MTTRSHELSALIDPDRRDVVSVALDVDPTRPEHQRPNPAYRIWARTALQQIVAAAPRATRNDLSAIAHRVDARLQQPVAGHGLVILATPDLWRERAVPDPLPNRAEYGRPDLLPVLWADREYRPWIVVLVDAGHARIVSASPERTVVVHEERLDLDTSHWRFKAGRPPAATKRAGIGAARGVQRDTFDARVDEQIHRFWHATAQRAAQTAAALSIDRMVIAGPERAAGAVRESMPEATRAMVVGLVPLPSHTRAEDVAAHTLPLIAAQARHQTSRLLGDLVAGGGAHGAVLGRAATLEALMRGEVMTIVAARDLDGTVWECPGCAYVAATQAGACPACGTATGQTSLRQILPVLVQRHGAELVVVGPGAQPALPDGLGAHLRYALVSAPPDAGRAQPLARPG